MFFQLRPEQIAAFEEEAQQGFRSRVVVYLRHRLPVQTAMLTEGDLLARVQLLQQRARAYGVVSERAVAKWAFLGIVLGERFDGIPAIHEYLRNNHLTPMAKVDGLMKTLYIRLRAREAGGK